MTSESRHSTSWLRGPASDLLLGCGGLYLLLLVPFALFGRELRLSQPLLLFPILSLLVSSPHYGATLLRVYEDRYDRRAYAIFSIAATAVIATAFFGSLWIPALGSFLVTLYLSWSPWHYTGQNYGIAVMFLRRSGVTINASDKRWIYISFVSSFVLVLLFMHGAGGSARDLPVYNASESVNFRPLGIPSSVTAFAVPAVSLVYLLSLTIAGVRLSRLAPLRDLLPFALLSLSQVFWFVLPLGAAWAGWQPATEVFRSEFRTHYFFWIGMAHSIQYLWVTSYYAKQSKHWHGQPLWYAKVVASGAAIWMAPALIFGPMSFGPLAMDQGLTILIAAAVNLHHFVLDGAIWKLRGRIAEVLIRRGRDDSALSLHSRSPLRRLVWLSCALVLGVSVFHIHYEARGTSATRVAEARRALDRLAWFGLDRVHSRMRLAMIYLSNGRSAAAEDQIRRSLELTPLAGSWVMLGRALLESGEPREALSAFREAQRKSPEVVAAYRGEASAQLRLGEWQAALAAIDHALRLSPDDAAIVRERDAIRAQAH